MPSASIKLDSQGSQELLDPIQKVIQHTEKKIRNLEKRKNKLEQYRVDLRAGKQLNEDQQTAVANYEQVLGNLEMAKELSTHFAGMWTDRQKEIKKQLKREHQERVQDELDKVKEILKVQDVLQQMGQDVARTDFLAGINGACLVAQEQLDQIDNLFKLVTPVREEGTDISTFDEQVSTSAEHLIALVEGRNKEIAGTTYKDLISVVQEISSCTYPDAAPEVVEAEISLEEEVVETPAEYTNGDVEVEEIMITEDVGLCPVVVDGSEMVSVLATETHGPPPPGMVAVVAAPQPMAPHQAGLPQDLHHLQQQQQVSQQAPAVQEALVAVMAQMTTASVAPQPPQQQPTPTAAAPLSAAAPPQSYFTAHQQQQQQQAQLQQQQQPVQVPPQPQIHQISLSDLVPPGNFDFLQESQVAPDNAAVYLDPAVVSIGNSVKPTPESLHTVVPPQSAVPMVNSVQDLSCAPPTVPTQTYSTENYNGMPVQQVQYSQNMAVYNTQPVDTTPNPPPPIPLPPQTRVAPEEVEATSWNDQQPPAAVPHPQSPPQQSQHNTSDGDWQEDSPVNGGDKWAAESGNWADYEDQSHQHTQNNSNDGERRGGYRGRGGGRGFGRGGFRGGRGGGNYQNGNRGGYYGGGGGGGYRGGRGGNVDRSGGDGYRGQRGGGRGGFRGQNGSRGGGFRGGRGGDRSDRGDGGYSRGQRGMHQH